MNILAGGVNFTLGIIYSSDYEIRAEQDLNAIGKASFIQSSSDRFDIAVIVDLTEFDKELFRVTLEAEDVRLPKKPPTKVELF